jgi:hypothetical protein
VYFCSLVVNNQPFVDAAFRGGKREVSMSASQQTLALLKQHISGPISSYAFTSNYLALKSGKVVVIVEMIGSNYRMNN